MDIINSAGNYAHQPAGTAIRDLPGPHPRRQLHLFDVLIGLRKFRTAKSLSCDAIVMTHIRFC